MTLDPNLSLLLTSFANRLDAAEKQIASLTIWMNTAAGDGLPGAGGSPPIYPPSAYRNEPAAASPAGAIEGEDLEDLFSEQISAVEREQARVATTCPVCQAPPQHECRLGARIGTTHDARVHALRAKSKDAAVPPDLAARVSKLELELYGDPATLARWEAAWKLGVTPRPEKPGPGFLDRFKSWQTSIDQQITKFRGFLMPFDVVHSQAPLDGLQIATKAWVDEGLQRLGGALRGELVPKAAATTGSSYIELFERVNRLSRETGGAVSFVQTATAALFGGREVGRDGEVHGIDQAATFLGSQVRGLPRAVSTLGLALAFSLSKKGRVRLRRGLRSMLAHGEADPDLSEEILGALNDVED